MGSWEGRTVGENGKAGGRDGGRIGGNVVIDSTRLCTCASFVFVLCCVRVVLCCVRVVLCCVRVVLRVVLRVRLCCVRVVLSAFVRRGLGQNKDRCH